MKVLQIGGYPPPFGGVSTHVRRLQQLCVATGIDSQVLDTSGQPKVAPGVVTPTGTRARRLLELAWYVWRTRADVVHIHLSSVPTLIASARLLLAAAGRAKLVISLHSGSFIAASQGLSRRRRRSLASQLRRFHHVLAANDHQAAFLVAELGIDAHRIQVVPAYLPPVGGKGARLPDELAAFTGRHSHVALVTGFARHYYGFHTALMALGQLANPAVGIILHLYTASDSAYLQELDSMAAGRPDVLISRASLDDDEMAALIDRCSIFVRATARDGDSVALREAVFFRRQIIATDCVPRPNGALLFPFEDAAALAGRLAEAIADPAAGVIAADGAISAHGILDTYRSRA